MILCKLNACIFTNSNDAVFVQCHCSTLITIILCKCQIALKQKYGMLCIYGTCSEAYIVHKYSVSSKCCIAV